MLGYGITREGSFYMLSTPLDKGNKNDHNLRSGEITFELHNESGKQKMSFEFENGGVIDGSTVIEDENGIRLKVLRILANGGIIVSILEVKDGELIEKSHVKIPYSDLYAGNNSNNISNFENRIKEKKEGVIKMNFNVNFTQDHKLLNGGYISINEMKVNAISVLLLTFIDANGEIVRTNCLHASSIVATGIDADGALNIFLNDADSRYSKEGSFVSYSNAVPTADESPVHLVIDENGEVLKRQILTNGFDKGEKFDRLFKFYSFEANGIILTAKSDCRDSSGNTCYSFTLGTISLN
jgi:hypothetical protein